MKKILLLIWVVWVLAKDHHFLVIIPSYNNEKWTKKCLESLIAQDYHNWDALFIDDNSSDRNASVAERVIQELGYSHKIKIIRNTQRWLAMANFYYAIHNFAANDDIVTLLDGDDWYKHNHVLSRLNHIYQDEKVWVTYGSYEDWPQPEKASWDYWMKKYGPPYGVCDVSANALRRNNLRNAIGIHAPVRSFYAWLFKEIQLSDFLWQGEFLPMTCDLAMMIPLLELSGGRFRCVKEILYVHNVASPLNDHKVNIGLQTKIDHYVRSLKPYQPLKESLLPWYESLQHQKIDVILIHDNEREIRRIVQLLNDNTSVATIFVLSQMLVSDLPEKAIIRQSDNFHEKHSIMNEIQLCKEQYILIITKPSLIGNQLSLSDWVKYLEQTHAFAFHGDKSAMRKSVRVSETIVAMQYCHESCNTFFDCTLYRKEDLLKLKKVSFESINDLKNIHFGNDKLIGLFNR